MHATRGGITHKRERERESREFDTRYTWFTNMATSTGKEPLSGLNLQIGMVTMSLEASFMLHPILHSMSSHNTFFM